MSKLHLTTRALDDLQEIFDYSAEKWGEEVALKYIQSFEDAFSILKENKDILKVNSNISSKFRVYFVKKHGVICDVVKDTIFILTIRHTSMNLLERLKDLEPNLEEEVKILHNKLNSR